MKKVIEVKKWEYHPLTPERWDDFELLFGPNGACAGCWCEWFLMTNKEFNQSPQGRAQRCHANARSVGRGARFDRLRGRHPGRLGGTGAA